MVNPTWTVQRRSCAARFLPCGLVDSGQRSAGDPRRLYTSEDAALTRVCEDLARLGEANRVDPAPVARRRGDSIIVTADNVGAVYVVRRRQA